MAARDFSAGTLGARGDSKIKMDPNAAELPWAKLAG